MQFYFRYGSAYISNSVRDNKPNRFAIHLTVYAFHQIPSKMNFLKNLLPKIFKKTTVSDDNLTNRPSCLSRTNIEKRLRQERIFKGEPAAIRDHYHRKNIEADLNWERACQSAGLRSPSKPVPHTKRAVHFDMAPQYHVY